MSSIFTLGVIPARGGSKTIPRKNLYPLNGVPLIAYTILAAQGSKLDDFIVTTDDDEIAAYSESLGAKVIRRPAELAQDDTPMVPAVQHAVEEYEYRWGDTVDPDDYVHVDAVCLLQPTSPLRTAEDIDRALEGARDVSSLVSVAEGVHPMKSYVEEDGRWRGFEWIPYDRHKDRCLTRNGAIFIVTRELLDKGILVQNPRLYLMPEERSVDVDDQYDLLVAEALLKAGVVA